MPFYLGRKSKFVTCRAMLSRLRRTKGEVFGAREQVGAICEETGFQSAFLVTDETIFGLSLHGKVTASLEE